MTRIKAWFLSFFDILREFRKRAIESLFVGVIIGPFVSSLTTILSVIVFGLVGLTLTIEGLIVWGESALRMCSAIEGSNYFGLVSHFFIFFLISHVIIRGPFVFIAAK